MDELLQRFEAPVVGRDGNEYDVSLYGRSRPHDTWEGWLLFVRKNDGREFRTEVETTQPSAEMIVYWASGLTDAYLEGALERALRPPTRREAVEPAMPVVAGGVDATLRAERLSKLERDILELFHARHDTRLLMRSVFDDLPHGRADLVRAVESLEKQRRALVRTTEEGNDWLFLTELGVKEARVTDAPRQPYRVVGKPGKPLG